MAAASRALRDDPPPCLKCAAELRCYFHVFQPKTGQGSVWLWCSGCRIYTVHATRAFRDPFADVSRGEFAALETSRDDAFLDRLERLWLAGELAPTASPR